MKRVVLNMRWLFNMPKTGNDILDEAISCAFMDVGYVADNEEFNLLNVLNLLSLETGGAYLAGKKTSQKVFIDSDIVDLMRRTLSKQLIELEPLIYSEDPDIPRSIKGGIINTGVIKERLSLVKQEKDKRMSSYIKEFLTKIREELVNTGDWDTLNKYEIYPILYEVMAGAGILTKDETKNNKEKYDVIRNYYR